MKIIVEIEIDEEEYREAVTIGWNDRFGEELTSDEVIITNNPSDFQHAAVNMPEDSFKSIEVIR